MLILSQTGLVAILLDSHGSSPLSSSMVFLLRSFLYRASGGGTGSRETTLWAALEAKTRKGGRELVVERGRADLSSAYISRLLPASKSTTTLFSLPFSLSA